MTGLLEQRTTTVPANDKVRAMDTNWGISASAEINGRTLGHGE